VRASLRAGGLILAAGGAAVDAVEAAVCVLEDFELFNAGRGSHPTTEGGFEMDAAIMRGSDRRAGAVAALAGVRNPIRAARAVLDHSPHLLLAGAGAGAFAHAQGLEPSDVAELQAAQRARQDAARGTVGAVARDARGQLGAATSTGGMRGQLPGRVGDSPLVGAGIWADNRSCAVSGTGDGEVFIRTAFAHEIDARVRLLHTPLAAACDAALASVLALGGSGGCIALGPTGEPVFALNTTGMPRGALGPGEDPAVAIYADEALAR
jgi:beta-aspartyl-peptidase (threonine type)